MQGYSKGCSRCLRRKVKCDEERPACLRCRRRGETCPGYRDQVEWRFKLMNQDLVQKAGHTSLTTYSPVPSWEQQTIPYFFHNYTLLPTAERRGYLEFVPHIFAQSKQGSALNHAVLAAAMASFGNVSGLQESKMKAQVHYGHALGQIRQSLSKPEPTSDDSLLLSIVLLHMFEIINGLKTTSADHHEEALLHLQRSREDGLMTPFGQQLSNIIQALRSMSGISGSHSRPVLLKEDNSPPGHNDHRSANIWQLLGRTSYVCQQIQQLLANKRKQNGSWDVHLDHVFEEALELYKQFSLWPNVMSTQQQCVSTEMQHDGLGFPGSFYTFENIQHGAVWISFWCAEISFLKNMKTLMETLDSSDELGTFYTSDQFEEMNERQMAAVTHICRSSAYMLGETTGPDEPQNLADSKDLGSFFLLRGLYQASQVDRISTEQRAFILERLKRIGHYKGIKLAFNCRDRMLGAQPNIVTAF